MTQYKIQEGMVYQTTEPGKWDQIEFFPTPNQGGLIRPKFLVIHFTAGSGDAYQTASYFQNPSAKASAHLNLSTDGTLTQSVSLEMKAWHAGKSQWSGLKNLNDHSIGIEVCNPGPLTITKQGYKSWFGKSYDDPSIIEAPHPNAPNGPVYGWIPFTQKQIEVLLSLGRVIVDHFNIIEVVGHDMISPGRKTDPGPCMDRRIYDMLNGGREDEKDSWVWYVGKVKDYLNGRSGPGTDYDVVEQLPHGTELEVLERQGVWWKVETMLGKELWVHSRFLQTRQLDGRD